MRLVKIKLHDSPFWFLGKLINLSLANPISDPINVDSLPDEEIAIIDKSASQCEIKLFDADGNLIKSLKDAGYIKGELAVDLGDVKVDESDKAPEVFSVTVDNDEDEEEEQEPEPTEVDYDNAELLLSKNGNTVKKTLRELPHTDEALMLLHACLSLEKQNKQRASIIGVIEQKIMGF